MKRISLLIKPASGLCDLRCRYCFYCDLKQYGAGNFGVMSRDTMICLIRRAFEEDGVHVSFCFQGGEPTMAGLDYFLDFVASVNRTKQPGQTASYAIQTNGIQIDEEWAEFLHENRFLVGLSIDGPREYHDAMRVDTQGKGTLTRVERAWRLLQKHGVETNILSVVTRNTARHAGQVYAYLKKLGGQYLQFIACLDPLGTERGDEAHSLTPPRYGKFLCELFDLWYADYKNGCYVSVRQFDDWVHNLAGMPVSTCMSTGRCGSYLVVEADGSAYPCDFYVTDQHRLGTVQETTLAQLSRQAEPFIQESFQQPQGCEDCPYRAACRGGCRRDRVIRDGVPVENYFCEAYQMLFGCAWDRMKELAAEERRHWNGIG